MKDAWFDQKTLIIETLIRPETQPVPSVPSPTSYLLTSPQQNTGHKEWSGWPLGGRGRVKRTFNDDDHSAPGVGRWELPLRRVLANHFFFSCRPTFDEDRSPSSKPLVTYVFRLWGLIFGNLTTQLLKLNSFVLSKNSGLILFSNSHILHKLSFKRYSVRN